jgi:hypothetical protein
MSKKQLAARATLANKTRGPKGRKLAALRAWATRNGKDPSRVRA